MRSRTRALLLTGLLAALALSGCTGDDGDADPDDNGTDPDPGGYTQAQRDAAGRFTPWTLSDHWVYDMQVRGLGRFDQTKLVFYEERGPEYVVGAPTYDEALYHAVFSVNPILGRIHKDLLSPHERGEHAHMYPFHRDPIITDGERWTTIFYENQVSLEATFDPAIPTPTGPEKGYRIHGENADGTFRIDYDYVPAVKWFTRFAVEDPDGVVFDIALAEFGTGYSGGAYFIRAKDFLHETIESEGLLQTTRTFRVEDAHVADKRVESFAVSADIDMKSGIDATLILRDPQNAEIWRKTFNDPQSGEYNIQELFAGGTKSTKPIEERPQWPAGTYTLEFRFSGEATADVHIVGNQDNSGRI